MSLPAAAEPAVATAAAVRSGASSALAETRAALDRIAALDPALGAFQLVRAERALAEAEAVDARLAAGEQLPLAGVPIAVKDNVPVAGEPMRVGSAATSHAPQLADHEVVARLRAAGAVVVGLTRVPELCVFGTTDSVFGTTRNPHALERSKRRRRRRRESPPDDVPRSTGEESRLARREARRDAAEDDQRLPLAVEVAEESDIHGASDPLLVRGWHVRTGVDDGTVRRRGSVR